MCLRPQAIKKQAEPVRIVPCGKCFKCLGRRSADWAFRLEQEQKQSTSSCFLTLTYQNTPLTKDGLMTLSKRDLQLFLKRLRKKIQYSTTSSIKQNKIKYYACGEYGTDYNRPHYHLILFNLPLSMINSSVELHSLWGLGHIQIDPCNEGSIRYVTNYITKYTPNIENDPRAPEFSTMSKNLGLNYLTPQIKKYHRTRLINYITRPGGQIQALPRYYKDILFDDEMKEILNEASQEARQINFELMFNNNNLSKYIWKKDQRRKDKKQKKLQRKTQFSSDNSTQLIKGAEAKLIMSRHKQLQT